MERRIGKEIKFIHILTSRYVTKHIKGKEQKQYSPIQIDIMEYLAETEGKIYQKDIEKEFQLRKSTISGILDTMQKNGIIDRIEDKEDFRSKQIELTEKGKKNYYEVIKEILKMEELIAKNISKQDVETFFRVTEKIKENLKNVI